MCCRTKIDEINQRKEEELKALNTCMQKLQTDLTGANRVSPPHISPPRLLWSGVSYQTLELGDMEKIVNVLFYFTITIYITIYNICFKKSEVFKEIFYPSFNNKS